MYGFLVFHMSRMTFTLMVRILPPSMKQDGGS